MVRVTVFVSGFAIFFANAMNRYRFTRHLSVIQNGYERGEYEQQSIHRRVQSRSGSTSS